MANETLSSNGLNSRKHRKTDEDKMVGVHEIKPPDGIENNLVRAQIGTRSIKGIMILRLERLNQVR